MKKSSLKKYIYKLYQEDIKHPMYDPNRVRKSIYSPSFTETYFNRLVDLPSVHQRLEDEDLDGVALKNSMPGKINYNQQEHIQYLIHQIHQYLIQCAKDDLYECKFLVPEWIAGMNAFDFQKTFNTLLEYMKKKKGIQVKAEKPYLVFNW